MLVLGLTGVIASGKSATLRLFAAAGAAVFDADAAVHELYRGAAAAEIGRAFPGTVDGGAVNRERLAAAVVGDPEALTRLEAIVHPLVRRQEEAFLAAARAAGRRVAALDIPLLFETGADARVDATIAVTAPPKVLRERALARPGMTAGKLDALLARQLSDAEKRRRAHFVIDTGRGVAVAEAAVRDVLRAVAPLAAGR